MRAYLALTLLVAGLVGLAMSGDLIVHDARFVTFYGLAGLGFGLLATAATSLPLRAALVAAVVLRLVFLPGTPSLSDDYHRYAWDGRVQLAGQNPYRYTPTDPALDAVSYGNRGLINHPGLRTVYPPLAQTLFLGIAGIELLVGAGGDSSPGDDGRAWGALPFKLLFGGFEMATAALVWAVAGVRRHAATVLYLLCPAVILQTWEAAHLEAVAVFFVLAAAALLMRGRDWQAGVALGLATALKVTPLILLAPALLGGRAKPARLLAGLVPALLIPYVPYLLTGGATGSLLDSGTRWTGGAVVFSLLTLAVVPEIARVVCLALTLASAVWIARRLTGRGLTVPAFAWTLSLMTLCLPVVHAWYWLAPLTLALAAGLWLPVAIGTVAPVAEALAPAWPGRFPPWRQIGVRLSGLVGLAHTRAKATSTPGARLVPRRDPQSRVFDDGRAALAVMAKPPIPGTVKTRLAATIGDEAAAKVYSVLLRDALDQAQRLKADRLPRLRLVLAEAPATEAAGPTGRDLLRTDILAGRDPSWERLEQRGAGLGERLAAVFADLFSSGAETVAIASSDSPPVPLDYLEQAFSASRTGALVLGPAVDGGYYLIGCGRETWLHRGGDVTGLLAASPMSDPALLTHTVGEAAAIGLTPILLPLWLDIDEPADLGILERLGGDEPLRGEPLESLREIYIHLTHACGRDCRHCYNRDAVRDPDELTTAEWRDAIDQCVALGASSFVFIGGDPLLRDDFTELVDHATGRHGARVRFFFNSFVDEALAAELARAGRGLLRPLASVDGPRAVNDALRGEGSYDDVMASIAHLRHAGLDPVVNTVLVRPALPGLTQLAHELREAGVGRLHLILPHQAGGAGGAPDLIPDAAEMLVAVRRLLTTAAAIGLTVDNLSAWRRRIGARNDFCASGCKDLAIDPYGQVHACAITAGDPAFAAGALRGQPLEQIWRGSAGLRLLRASRARDRSECAACPVVDACGGECWVQAHYAARARGRSAGYAAPFPYCGLVRPILQDLAAEARSTALPTGTVAGGDCVAAGACGGQAAAGRDAYSLFDCI